VLVSSLGIRIAAQLSGRRRPRENCPYRVASSSELPANAWHLVLLESGSVPRFLTTDEVEIRFEVLGTGPPLLVCHGGPSNVCDTLISDLAGLSPHFTLVFHDYRGSGQSSSAPEDTYTFARLADDLEELRRHLNLGSVPVLAHSMGGLVAMEFALRHGTAKSLILAGVTPCMSPASTAAPMIRALGPRRTGRMAALALWFLVAWSWRSASTGRTAAMYAPTDVTQEARRDRRRMVAETHPGPPVSNDNATELQRAIVATDLRQRLHQIRFPVLVMYGSRDAMMVVGARMLESHLADATVIRLDDVGHEVFIEEPDLVFMEIRRFVEARDA
jgi:pimeloyl-ACP methyl ester carboxylesterase